MPFNRERWEKDKLTFQRGVQRLRQKVASNGQVFKDLFSKDIDRRFDEFNAQQERRLALEQKQKTYNEKLEQVKRLMPIMAELLLNTSDLENLLNLDAEHRFDALTNIFPSWRTFAQVRPDLRYFFPTHLILTETEYNPSDYELLQTANTRDEKSEAEESATQEAASTGAGSTSLRGQHIVVLVPPLMYGSETRVRGFALAEPLETLETRVRETTTARPMYFVGATAAEQEQR